MAYFLTALARDGQITPAQKNRVHSRALDRARPHTGFLFRILLGARDSRAERTPAPILDRGNHCGADAKCRQR